MKHVFINFFAFKFAFFVSQIDVLFPLSLFLSLFLFFHQNLNRSDHVISNRNLQMLLCACQDLDLEFKICVSNLNQPCFQHNRINPTTCITVCYVCREI